MQLVLLKHFVLFVFSDVLQYTTSCSIPFCAKCYRRLNDCSVCSSSFSSPECQSKLKSNPIKYDLGYVSDPLQVTLSGSAEENQCGKICTKWCRFRAYFTPWKNLRKNPQQLVQIFLCGFHSADPLRIRNMCTYPYPQQV